MCGRNTTMKHVRLTIRAPEGALHPVFDVLTRAAHVRSVTGLHWNFSGSRLGTLHYVEGDADAYVADMESIPSVLDVSIAPAGEGAFYAYHQCTVDGETAALWATLTEGTLLVVPPAEFGRDGAVTFSMFGEPAELQAAVDAVPEQIDVDIREVSGMAGAPRLAGAALSERQREAVAAALDLGYYEIPREAGHEAVADAIDCAPSTAAEHLRKAEAKLIRTAIRG